MIKLYQYQQDTYERIKTQDKLLIGHQVGLGKTITTLTSWWKLHNQHLFVVAPVSIDSWVKHAKFFPHATVIDLRLETSTQAIRTIKREIIENTTGRKIFICSYNSVWRYGNEILAFPKDTFTIVMDESQNVKNRTSKQAKFCLKLSQRYSKTLLLSGTPMSTGWEGMYHQIKILGGKEPFFLTWKAFEDTFLIIESKTNYQSRFGYKTVIGYKNISLLLESIKPYVDMVSQEDAKIELPEQIEQVIYANYDKEYHKAMKSRVFGLWKLQNAGGKMMAHRTGASGFLYGYDQFNNQKIELFKKNQKAQILKDLLDSIDKTVIIFYNFVGEAKVLTNVAKEMNRTIGFVSGGSFDIDKQIIAIQYQSGSTGLNLQDKSNIIIYYSPTISGVNFLQSKGRIHRIGQELPCFYYHIIMKDSIEEKILEKVQKNKDYTDQLFEKDYEEKE